MMVRTRVRTRLIASLRLTSLPIASLLIASFLTFFSCIPPSPSDPHPHDLPPHTVIQYRETAKDSFDIMSPTIKVPTEDAGYTLIYPTDTCRGLVLVFHAGRDTSHPGFEQRLAFDALRQHVATLYLTTGHRFDFLFDSSRYTQLDRYITKAKSDHNLSEVRALFTGMSLAGTRAMKMALWYLQGNGNSNNAPDALAICDAPLDFIRFWKAQQHARINETHPTSVSEASWTNYLLEQNLGGTPYDARNHYTAYSPYVKMDSIDPKIQSLVSLPMRVYSEPDLDWWMENRNRDAYGMNSLDASALIGDIRLLGNKKAYHMTTNNQGFRPDGTRHPHSWSIVDNQDLIRWFVELD